MGKAPWFALNVHDWLTSIDVQRMTLAEVGAYINLLCRAWDSHPIATLPNDPAKLWKLAGARSLAEFEAVAPVVLGMFEEQDGRLTNARLREEISRLDAQTNKARNAANARWGGSMHKHAQPSTCMQTDATETETEYTSEQKQNQLSQCGATSEAKTKSESVVGLNGSQSQPQKDQPESAAPPTQQSAQDSWLAATAALNEEFPSTEPAIAFAKRMVDLWHKLRLEQKYVCDVPEFVETSDFMKLTSPTWLMKNGFREGLSYAEIVLCLRWALTVSTYWTRKNMLLGSDGFVHAFSNIKSQCFNYHSKIEMRNVEKRVKFKNAHPRLQEPSEKDPKDVVVKPGQGKKDDSIALFTEMMQELKEMSNDPADFPIGSNQWKIRRYKQLTEEEGLTPGKAEDTIQLEFLAHEREMKKFRSDAREGKLSADKIQEMLAATKVRDELADVVNL